MSQQILLTGPNTEPMEVNVLWSDRNNVRQGAKVEIDITDARILHVRVNGVTVAAVSCSEMTREMAVGIARMV